MSHNKGRPVRHDVLFKIKCNKQEVATNNHDNSRPTEAVDVLIGIRV